MSLPNSILEVIIPGRQEAYAWPCFWPLLSPASFRSEDFQIRKMDTIVNKLKNSILFNVKLALVEPGWP